MNCEIDIRNSTIEKHMNHLWTIYFHDLIVFVNSQDRISKEIMSTLTFQAFFISFLLLVFLIETSGNSISFLAVIIVDVLLVHFNYDKCYNNECIYYEHSHCITFFRRWRVVTHFIHWVNLNCRTRLSYAKIYWTSLHVGEIRTILSLKSHTFFIYCAIS